MQVQSLEAFGVHRDLLRAWENNYSKELLPVQAEAVEDLGTDIAETSFGEAVVAVTLQLPAQGEPTLVFVKDRRNSVRWAYRLAECVSRPPSYLHTPAPGPSVLKSDKPTHWAAQNPADVVY